MAAARVVTVDRWIMQALMGAAAIAAVAVGRPSVASAQPAWPFLGVLVSNMCRAPSGAWWLFPPQYAQPVGSGCTIPTTGEAGVVTDN